MMDIIDRLVFVTEWVKANTSCVLPEERIAVLAILADARLEIKTLTADERIAVTTKASVPWIAHR